MSYTREQILISLLEGYWRDVDGTLADRIAMRDLGGRIREVAAPLLNSTNRPSLEEAIQLAGELK
jgi:hypothetical protein